MKGGIRHKVFCMMLATLFLIIAAYTAVFFYQSSRVEQLVNDTFGSQKQIYTDIFREEMFHARNILMLLVFIIVAAALASAYSITKRITDPLNTITRRVASLGVRNGQFEMDDIYRTGDEIEVLAESFARESALVAQYVDRIKAVTAEKERIQVELDMSSRIQQSQLPRTFPPFPERDEFSLYAFMTPAKEVGGDFYDFFMVDQNHIAFVMADVSGKGVPAALMMMVTRTLIKSSLQNGSSPSETLKSVNEQICEGNEESLFVTVWLAVLEISSGKGIAANAGHEHPVVRRRDADYELQIYKHSMPIGTMSGLEFKQHEFQMYPGDSFFVYTDGVPEASNDQNELFGTGRMLDALNKDPDADTEQTLSNVMDSINRFVDAAEQFDDITMMCFSYYGRSEQ